MSFFLIILFSFRLYGAENALITIPKGELRAFWLAPKTSRDKKRSNLPKILISSFKIMDRPVTQGQFREFLKTHSEWKKENVTSIYVDQAYLKDYSAENDVPMTNISWFAARSYCESRKMRLPTVNEWEYVAAASEDQKDANRNQEFLQRILAWYAEPKGKNKKKVASIYKNIYGVWDMHGLVWEWVEDFNSSFVTGESREDSAFNKNLFCGGGALSMADKQNYAAFMRFAFRSGLTGRSSVWNLGFRCVRDL
ncbi:MAG: formylglycine-generating enzyme family protein [Bdellovibrionales bacterium]|nr:formylglycine-generating enzyme family protein [Bdellovibrionales bacterium]